MVSRTTNPRTSLKLVQSRTFSECGFSLLLSLMALTILGITFTGLTSLMKVSLGAQRKITSSLNIENQHASLLNLLQLSDLCRCNLSPPGAPGPYSFLESNAGKANFPINTIRVFNTTGGACTPTAHVIATVGKSESGHSVESIQLKDFVKVDPSKYFAHLVVTFQSKAVPYPKVKQYSVAFETITSPGGQVKLHNCLGPQHPSLGDHQTLGMDTVHQAASDGIVHVRCQARWTNPPSWGGFVIYRDVVNPPTLQGTVANAPPGYDHTATLPVKKGHYWKVASSNRGCGISRIEFTPLL